MVLSEDEKLVYLAMTLFEEIVNGLDAETAMTEFSSAIADGLSKERENDVYDEAKCYLTKIAPPPNKPPLCGFFIALWFMRW